MIKPIKNRLAVKMIEKKKVTDSGIILTATDPLEATQAEVVAIGEDVTEVDVGDILLINWNSAQKIRDGLDDFYILTEDNVILVFED